MYAAVRHAASRLLKNTPLLRCAHPSSLQRTAQYASFLVMSRALHLNVFDQPEKNNFFNNRLLVFTCLEPVNRRFVVYYFLVIQLFYLLFLIS